MLKRKKGFSLIETIATALIMSTIVMAVVSFSVNVSECKTQEKNTVYLTQHNLNCIEQLRQMCREGDGDLLAYYGDDTFGTLDIETEVQIETSTWDHFKVYDVTLTSKQKTGVAKGKLVNHFVMTNIGGIADDF